MKITTTEEYGMRCMRQLALCPGQTVALNDLAEAEGIALPVAAKVLLRLKNAKLVLATRGRTGGYTLARPAQDISVASILKALGKPLFDSSFCRIHGRVGKVKCSRASNCSIRPVWAHLDSLLTRFFETTTLAQLAGKEFAMDQHLSQTFPLVMPAFAPGHTSVQSQSEAV